MICLVCFSGEASVALSASGSASLGSASQLFIRGPESDREDCESSSQLGLAGSIVSRRLEVHAEVSASPKRSAFIGETTSATVSLSERSTSLSMADDGAASTRALAGSLLSYKVPLLLHSGIIRNRLVSSGTLLLIVFFSVIDGRQQLCQ